MAAINIELLDALKKAGVDEQKRGQSLWNPHEYNWCISQLNKYLQ